MKQQHRQHEAPQHGASGEKFLSVYHEARGQVNRLDL
jgi:hypothetical protein